MVTSPKDDAPPSPNQGQRQGPKRELIEANHSFPGPYTIKAFGPGTDAFRQQVAQAAEACFSPSAFRSRERGTASGRSVCITLELEAEKVEQVTEIYSRLYAIETLKLIL